MSAWATNANNSVGLVFDGNIESLIGNTVFNEATNRAVAVHSAGMLEALRKLFDAGVLANELTGVMMSGAAEGQELTRIRNPFDVASRPVLPHGVIHALAPQRDGFPAGVIGPQRVEPRRIEVDVNLLEQFRVDVGVRGVLLRAD